MWSRSGVARRLCAGAYLQRAYARACVSIIYCLFDRCRAYNTYYLKNHNKNSGKNDEKKKKHVKLNDPKEPTIYVTRTFSRFPGRPDVQ